jgi:general secretion pathway protein D
MSYTSAKLVEGHLNGIAKDVSSKLAGLIAIGDERSRTMILVGNKQSILESERVIASLDVPATADNFHIYRLQNADAKTVAEQLSNVLSIAARMQPDQKGVLPTSVVPDLPSNSIILTVPMEQYGAIKSIIEEMDTRPRQVLLRGLIAEVNLSKLADAGIDWSVWGGTAESNMLIGGQAALGDSSVPMEFMQWFREITSKQDTVTSSNGAITTTTNTQGMGLIYSYIRLLSSFHSLNVLSMPRLMCTDNLPSEMQVGYVIPQITGKTSEISNPSSVQSSYQYKDVGLIMNVTPHIRSGNLVALDIEQIVEEPMTTNSDNAPTTNKRRIKTNVIVGDNQTIILGGLIREAERTLKNRVPGLSYIPLIGNLFTRNGRDREKLELMVFLTPLILETPEAATKATIEATTGNRMSVGEGNTVELYNAQFDKSNKAEGIPKEIMLMKSEDVKPAAPDSDADTDAPGDQGSAQK